MKPDITRQENWLGQLLYLGNFLYCEQQDNDSGYLLFGGMLLGDTFHAIPLLNWLTGERSRSKIIWWTGTYEKPAVEFLRNFYPLELRYFADGIPDAIKDRDRFIEAHLSSLMKVLKKVPWEVVDFDSKNNRSFKLRNMEKLHATPGNCLVIHPASRHSWKNSSAIHALDWRQFDLPIVTVGAPGEYLIPGSLDFRGRPFLHVAQVLASARLIVAIHSAIACLSLYLDRPLIVCAPHPDPAYPRFGALKPAIVDLCGPTPQELRHRVGQCLEKSDFPSAPLSSLPGECRSPLPSLQVGHPVWPCLWSQWQEAFVTRKVGQGLRESTASTARSIRRLFGS